LEPSLEDPNGNSSSFSISSSTIRMHPFLYSKYDACAHILRVLDDSVCLSMWLQVHLIWTCLHNMTVGLIWTWTWLLHIREVPNQKMKLVSVYSTPCSWRAVVFLTKHIFVPWQCQCFFCRKWQCCGTCVLTVTARPRFRKGVCIFDGKVRCFPLVTYKHVKRNSVMQRAGTMEVMPITCITKDVIRTFMLEKVLPAIWTKWPHEDANKPIYIQQDNAPLHLHLDDP
jgi:hypothetical protein